VKHVLDFLIVVSPAGVVLAALVTFLKRLEAKSISMGILPEELAEKLARHHRHSDEELEGTLLGERDGARDRFFARAASKARHVPVRGFPELPLTMRDHMQVVDTHLLRAQDYVAALGSGIILSSKNNVIDGHAKELDVVFRRLRSTREALRAVARGELPAEDLPS
jgi:hypothetical protein